MVVSVLQRDRTTRGVCVCVCVCVKERDLLQGRSCVITEADKSHMSLKAGKPDGPAQTQPARFPLLMGGSAFLFSEGLPLIG